jgi:hypothetical protein
MLFQEYSLGGNVLDFKINESDLASKLTNFNDTLATQKQQCHAHAEIVKQQTRHMWKQVFSSLTV